MKNKKYARCKNMMYTQQIDHLPAKTVDDLVKLIEDGLKPKKYAVNIHDKDTDEKGQPVAPHVNAMLSFDNARSIESVAKILGDKSQYIEMWSGRAENGYAYLIHATDKARDKYQYDANEVIANFDYLGMMAKISQEVKNSDTYGDASLIKRLLNLLYEGKISKKEVEERLTGQQYAKASRQIEIVHAKYLQREAEKWRRKMIAEGKRLEVIWICGKAGTGKTSLAKEYAEKKGHDFYISGSSRDIFQGYMGEHVVILDELRPGNIPYSDLLRILDPYGVDSQVMAPSRYTDKALATELIIITSPYNPWNYYREEFRLDYYSPNTIIKKVDSFAQLERRIMLTIMMTENEICSMEYDSTFENYKKNFSSIRPNPYSSLNRPATAGSSEDIYKSMFE